MSDQVDLGAQQHEADPRLAMDQEDKRNRQFFTGSSVKKRDIFIASGKIWFKEIVKTTTMLDAAELAEGDNNVKKDLLKPAAKPIVEKSSATKKRKAPKKNDFEQMVFNSEIMNFKYI